MPGHMSALVCFYRSNPRATRDQAAGSCWPKRHCSNVQVSAPDRRQSGVGAHVNFAIEPACDDANPSAIIETRWRPTMRPAAHPHGPRLTLGPTAGVRQTRPRRSTGQQQDGLKQWEPSFPALDPVDMASDQSFPASDPPAWIWRQVRVRAVRFLSRSRFPASCGVCYDNTHGRQAGGPHHGAQPDRPVRQGETRWPYHIFRLVRLRACCRSAMCLSRLRPRRCSRRSASKSCGSFFRLTEGCLCMRLMGRSRCNASKAKSNSQ